MDTNYINELLALEDKKETKTKLAEYGAEFGIVLKKSRTIEGMVADLQAGFKELSETPMPEDNDGLSISDLIDADDELAGKNDFIDGVDEAKVEAKLLFDAPSDLPEVVEVVEVVEEPVVEEPVVETVAYTAEVVDEPVIEAPVIPEPQGYVVPSDFSPTLIKIGPNNGYCTLPWWIYDWIAKTPDWKNTPNSFPHAYGVDTIISLIYYIQREGSVRIRETRNSSFVTLS